MHITLLSGAYKNAGDFLIAERTQKLIEHLHPGCEITVLSRREPLESKLDSINSSDAVVLAGGPLYLTNVYPDVIPMVQNLDDIQPPMMIVGGGWAGADAGGDAPFHYRFADSSRAFLKRVECDGFSLSCRDMYTVQALRHEGFESACMTGCPAWYDLDFVEKTTLQNEGKEIKKILVSDPAYGSNDAAALALVKYLCAEFPDAEVQFVFHRGTGSDQNTSNAEGQRLAALKADVEAMGVTTTDIAYGTDGFAIYDTADLHVGFRVHAHIYNLSRRRRTILIEEDGRGAGVNDALGLPALRAYRDGMLPRTKWEKRLTNRFSNRENPHVVEQFGTVLREMQRTDWQRLNSAFGFMNRYFETMCMHLRQLGDDSRRKG